VGHDDGVVDVLIALALFALGALLAIWATERLLEGLVALAFLAGLSAFVVSALLSGLEAENIAVGIAGSRNGAPAIALGSVFGGATFLVCVALGLGAIIAPLHVRLPRTFLLLAGLAPVLAGLALIGPVTSRAAGVVLLIAFGLMMAYLVRASRGHTLLESKEVAEASEEHHAPLVAVGLTVLGLVAVAIGGELVARGANSLVAHLAIPATLMGMVIAPAAIEAEEVIRQAVPAKEGHPEVSAGNLLGTLLYFTLFNLGIIAVVAPVEVFPSFRRLDWPFLVLATWVGLAFLWRGRVGRPEGAVLLALYALYVVLHIVVPTAFLAASCRKRSCLRSLCRVVSMAGLRTMSRGRYAHGASPSLRSGVTKRALVRTPYLTAACNAPPLPKPVKPWLSCRDRKRAASRWGNALVRQRW
jgi:cation:H+ antiporter